MDSYLYSHMDSYLYFHVDSYLYSHMDSYVFSYMDSHVYSHLYIYYSVFEKFNTRCLHVMCVYQLKKG